MTEEPAAAKPPADTKRSGPDAPAFITEKQWLELQLNVSCTGDAVQGLQGTRYVASVSGEAIEIEFSIPEHLQPLKPVWTTRMVTEVACDVVSNVQLPRWARELHIQVMRSYESERSDRFEVTRSRVSLPVSGWDCFGPENKLTWSVPTRTIYEAPRFDTLPLFEPKAAR